VGCVNACTYLLLRVCTSYHLTYPAMCFVAQHLRMLAFFG